MKTKIGGGWVLVAGLGLAVGIGCAKKSTPRGSTSPPGDAAPTAPGAAPTSRDSAPTPPGSMTAPRDATTAPRDAPTAKTPPPAGGPECVVSRFYDVNKVEGSVAKLAVYYPLYSNKSYRVGTYMALHDVTLTDASRSRFAGKSGSFRVLLILRRANSKAPWMLAAQASECPGTIPPAVMRNAKAAPPRPAPTGGSECVSASIVTVNALKATSVRLVLHYPQGTSKAYKDGPYATVHTVTLTPAAHAIIKARKGKRFHRGPVLTIHRAGPKAAWTLITDTSKCPPKFGGKRR